MSASYLFLGSWSRLLQVVVLAAVLLLCLTFCNGFSVATHHPQKSLVVFNHRQKTICAALSRRTESHCDHDSGAMASASFLRAESTSITTAGTIGPVLSRQQWLSSVAGILAGAAVSASILATSPAAAAEPAAQQQSFSIAACVKPASGAPANCVSTASVKQVDLYMAPWTWPEGTSVDEVVGRLKGVIDSDASLQLIDQQQTQDDDRRRYYFKVRAARNFNSDEIEFVVNPADRVITFKSQQVEGPESVSDFGGNRKRLEDVRKRIPFLQVMGAEFESADSGPREGVTGQLKAFWGLQSGGGFEKLLLDEDDDDY